MGPPAHLCATALAARGEPSTKFPRDETRREGSTCSPASIVIPFKRGTLPELPELLNISTAPSTCDTNKVVENFVIRPNLLRILGK